jgi:hypothetical protein
MPTIKTQLVDGDRRIITKVVNGQRRVSCSCCEDVECCMYPAEAVESGLITFEDLPDEILTVNGFSLPKVGPLDASGLVPFPYLVYYGQLGEGVGIATGEGLWSNQTDFSGGFGSTVDLACLFDGRFPKPESSDWYVDNFADIYNFDTGEGTTGTVTRELLCVWRGLTNNGCPVILSYDIDPDGDPRERLKWSIAVTFFNDAFGCEGVGLFVKNIQNSPEGEYFSPVADFPVTVFE